MTYFYTNYPDIPEGSIRPGDVPHYYALLLAVAKLGGLPRWEGNGRSEDEAPAASAADAADAAAPSGVTLEQIVGHISTSHPFSAIGFRVMQPRQKLINLVAAYQLLTQQGGPSWESRQFYLTMAGREWLDARHAFIERYFNRALARAARSSVHLHAPVQR